MNREPAGLNSSRLENVRVPVEMVQSCGSVRETEAGAPPFFAAASAAWTNTIVHDVEAQPVTSSGDTNSNRSTRCAVSDAVANGILDERLEQKARYQRGSKRIIHLELDGKAIAET